MSAPGTYTVEITLDAQADLEEIHAYISEHDSERAADHVIDEIEAAGLKLSIFPEKGRVPAEMLDLGIRDYRQTSWRRTGSSTESSTRRSTSTSSATDGRISEHS